jgi:hypothetical protein
MIGSLENNVIDALLAHRTSPAKHDETIRRPSLGVAAYPELPCRETQEAAYFL